jgi:hypothetical protein
MLLSLLLDKISSFLRLCFEPKLPPPPPPPCPPPPPTRSLHATQQADKVCRVLLLLLKKLPSACQGIAVRVCEYLCVPVRGGVATGHALRDRERARERDSMACTYTHIHTHTHTWRQACAAKHTRVCIYHMYIHVQKPGCLRTPPVEPKECSMLLRLFVVDVSLFCYYL